MSAKKIIVSLFVILVAIGGFVSGLLLLRQRQNLEEQAAVEDGQATVSISPETGSYDVGDTITSEVRFNTDGIAISGIAVRLYYPYSGNTPEVSVSQIDINPVLISSGDWTCPTENSSLEGGNVIIDVACSDLSADGFTTNTNTLLATITMEVNSVPANNPLLISFDPQESIISSLSGEDILLIPQSTATYTIGGATATATPTTEPGATATPTSAVTLTPTSTPSPSPTSALTATTTPTTTTKGGLPEAGVSYPTILGIGVGTLILITSIVLAL